MRFVFRFAARGPHDKKGDTVDHSDALKSSFVVCLSGVFASEEITVKKRLQIGEVDSMLIKIDQPLRFIPGDHVCECRFKCIYAQATDNAETNRCSPVPSSVTIVGLARLDATRL